MARKGTRNNRKQSRNNRAAAAAAVVHIDLEDAISIDGSIMEGGGQVLRQSTALSALLRKAIHIVNIRGKRSKPGLKAQHLTGINLVAELTAARISGNVLNSNELRFDPQTLNGGEYVADIGTAGSVCLLIQVSLLPLLFAPVPSHVKMGGGTNAIMAPQIDYALQVFQPIVERFGVEFEFEVEKRGYFPRGGGIVHVRTTPVADKLTPIEMTERGDIVSIRARTFVAGKLPLDIANKISAAAESTLTGYFNGQYGPEVAVEMEVLQEPKDVAVGDCCGILIVLETSTGCRIAGSALGERGVPSQQVGEKAAEELITGWENGGCTDEYLMDQMIVFMALADGVSTVLTGPLSLHTTTAIHFAQEISGAQFEVVDNPNRTGRKDQSVLVTCHGIGLSAQEAAAGSGGSGAGKAAADPADDEEGGPAAAAGDGGE